jgi:plastocyanin
MCQFFALCSVKQSRFCCCKDEMFIQFESESHEDLMSGLSDITLTYFAFLGGSSMITRVTRLLGILMLLAAFGVMLAACGGDSGSASSTTASGGSSSSSQSTGSSTAGTTVMIKETKDAAGKDKYDFDQTTLTVKAGDTVTFQNQSDELQDIDGGDSAKAGIDVKVPVNQSASATFKTPGTFKISSEKGATMTVTVQ